jgi:hypothetical protein
MSSGFAVFYSFVAVLGVAMMIFPFLRRFHDASLWLRLGKFMSGGLAIAWSALGFYLRMHEADGKTTLEWSRFWALEHMKGNIAGLVVGMVICLMLSPESRRLNRRKPSV